MIMTDLKHYLTAYLLVVFCAKSPIIHTHTQKYRFLPFRISFQLRLPSNFVVCIICAQFKQHMTVPPLLFGHKMVIIFKV